MKAKSYLFLALDTKIETEAHTEDTEKIKVEFIDFEKFLLMISRNEVQEEQTKLAALLTEKYLKSII